MVHIGLDKQGKGEDCEGSESNDYKVVYRRYASLFFIAGIDLDDNELLVLEVIHRYVEVLDKWFLNVCELDIIFNFQQAYTIMDELLIGGELQESSKRACINTLKRIEEVCAGQMFSNQQTEKQETAGIY
ncbi:hypothetical protein HDU96_007413 [Phlyctochytrium bullatum]|nr:hypothetical protein HDU96_007413 [Phlyctochytrium bullatum]